MQGPRGWQARFNPPRGRSPERCVGIGGSSPSGGAPAQTPRRQPRPSRWQGTGGPRDATPPGPPCGRPLHALHGQGKELLQTLRAGAGEGLGQRADHGTGGVEGDESALVVGQGGERCLRLRPLRSVVLLREVAQPNIWESRASRAVRHSRSRVKAQTEIEGAAPGTGQRDGPSTLARPQRPGPAVPREAPWRHPGRGRRAARL